jgi:nitrogen fixation/metabolism regulation signal transduction histidine kinase
MEIKQLRRSAATLLLLAAVALAVVGLVMLSAISRNSSEFGELYRTILFVNALGAAALLLLIGVNLVRLYRDYRAHVPGARLKVRLVTAFIALAVIPMAVVYAYAVQFLNDGIDSWFDVRVEQGLNDALELSRTALEARMRANLDETRHIADNLYGIPDREIYEYLTGLRMEAGAHDLTVFAGGTRIIATSSANPADQLPLLPTDEVTLSLRRDGFFVVLEPRPNGEYLVRTAVLLPGRSGREIRVLQALYPLGKVLAPLTESVQNTVSRYAELAFLRDPLKTSFILTLSMVLLLSLLLAVYGAFFFTRRLTAPVQSLVAGTRAVARGDFDTRLPSGSHDEIGFLVDSFNDMISQLSTARAEASRNEAQVENERASLAAILSRLSSGVIALENNLTIRTANDSASEILNVDFSGREGDSVLTMATDNPVLEQFVTAVRKHIDAGESEWREQLSLNVDGDRRVLVCACSKLPGSYRSASGYVIVFDDATELLRAQRDAAWGEVARRLAHEIKNPLTPIKLSAERIRHKFLGELREEDAETLDRSTQTIIRQVEVMRDMVNAFSEYARAPAMNMSLIDINQLISNVADLYPAYSGQPHLRLELGQNLPKVNVDALRMRQVLHNLIRNSLEALEEQNDGLVLVRTSIVQVRKRARLEIVVSDNGPGFPAEDIETIFEPYVTTKQKGTGLGLAIVRKLIEEHGGQVMIDNEAGDGAAIKILLPVDEAGDNEKNDDRINSDAARTATEKNNNHRKSA